MLLVNERTLFLKKIDFLVLLKASVVAFFGLYFLFEVGVWLTVLSSKILYGKALVLLGFSALYFLCYQFKNRLSLKSAVFLVCFFDIFFVIFYALYSTLPLNIFVGILSLNLLIAGLNLNKNKLFLITSLSVFAFTLFLNQKNLIGINYSFFYFFLNSLSFVIYSVAAYYFQGFLNQNQSDLKIMSKYLMKQRELNKAVLTSIDSAVFITGFDGVPISINKAAQDLSDKETVLDSLKNLSSNLLLRPSFVEQLQVDGRFYKIYGSSLNSELSVENTR